MAYVRHNRLVILGDLFFADQLETWAVTINFGGDLAPNPADPDHNVDIADAVSDFWAGLQSTNTYCDQWRIIGHKWNFIDTDGNYVTPQSPNTMLYPTPLTGSNTNPPTMPPQVALAVTLNTTYVGKSYTGRFFLPPSTAALEDGAVIPSATCSGVADNVRDFLDAMNTLGSFGGWGTGSAIVASSKGFNNAVTGVRVGNRYDTQRRRRRQLYESYSTVAELS